MRSFCASNDRPQIAIIITLQQILNLYHLSMSSHSEGEEAKYSDDQQQIVDQQEKNQESFLSQKNNQHLKQEQDHQIHDKTNHQPEQRDNLNQGQQNLQAFQQEQPKTHQAQKENQVVHQSPSEQQSAVQKIDEEDIQKGQHNQEMQIHAANQAIDITSQKDKVLQKQNNNIETQKADAQLGEHEIHNENDGQGHDEHNEQKKNEHNEQGLTGENEVGQHAQHAQEQNGQGDMHGHIDSEGQEHDRKQVKQQTNEEVEEDVKMQLRQENRTKQNLQTENRTAKQNKFTQIPTQSTGPILPAKNQEIVIQDKQQISNKISHSQATQQKKQQQNGSNQYHEKANQDSPATKVTEQQNPQKVQIGSRRQESRPLYQEDNLHGNDVGESVISRRVLAASVREKPQKEQQMGKKGQVCSCNVM